LRQIVHQPLGPWGLSLQMRLASRWQLQTTAFVGALFATEVE